jgi:hypothetical protein
MIAAGIYTGAARLKNPLTLPNLVQVCGWRGVAQDLLWSVYAQNSGHEKTECEPENKAVGQFAPVF